MASLPLMESTDSAETVGISGGSTQSTLSLGTFWLNINGQNRKSSMKFLGTGLSEVRLSIRPLLAAPEAHCWVMLVRSQLHTAPAVRGSAQGSMGERPSGV